MLRRIPIILLALLGGCMLAPDVNKLATADEIKLARDVVTELRDHDIRHLQMTLDPMVLQKNAAAVEQAPRILPSGKLTFRLINVRPQLLQLDEELRTPVRNFEMEVSDGQKHALAQILIHDEDTTPVVVGWRFQQVDRLPSVASEFGQAERTSLHYGMLALMAASFLTSWAAMYRMMAAPRLRLRWLWLIGAAISIISLRFDWTTGAMAFVPVSLDLFGISAIKYSPLKPWVLSTSIPVVAIVYLFMQHRLTRRPDSA